MHPNLVWSGLKGYQNIKIIAEWLYSNAGRIDVTLQSVSFRIVFFLFKRTCFFFAGNPAKRQKTCDNLPGPINSPPMSRVASFPSLPAPVSMPSGAPADTIKTSNPNTPMLGRSNSTGNISNQGKFVWVFADGNKLHQSLRYVGPKLPNVYQTNQKPI